MNKKTSPNRKIALILTVGFLLTIAFIGTASAKTITVDNSGGADYRTIQAAVDVAEDGDTIKVAAGTYRENIKIGRYGKPHEEERHKLKLSGENKDTTIIDGGGEDEGNVTIESWITVDISGFTIRNGKSGIKLNKQGEYGANSRISNNIIKSNIRGGITFEAPYVPENVVITNNIISENECGVGETRTTASLVDSEIGYNTISNNKYSGIRLYLSTNNKILNNKITNNIDGIHLNRGKQNTISKNTISDNDNGVVVKGMYDIGVPRILPSKYNKITDNTISSNNNGIYLTLATENEIVKNKIEESRVGILLEDKSTYNKIEDNTIKSNTNGVHLYSTCDYNEIKTNEVLKNTIYDIVVESDYNFITDNTGCVEDKGDGNQVSGNECPNQTPTPSPTSTPTPTSRPSPTPTLTPTLTPILTPTPRATLTPLLTPTPVVTPSVTPSPSPSPTPAPQGFESVFALAGLLAVAYLLRRR